MEYIWNDDDETNEQDALPCLNPCFNGIQMEPIGCYVSPTTAGVLILVLMEYKWNALFYSELYFRSLS